MLFEVKDFKTLAFGFFAGLVSLESFIAYKDNITPLHAKTYIKNEIIHMSKAIIQENTIQITNSMGQSFVKTNLDTAYYLIPAARLKQY